MMLYTLVLQFYLKHEQKKKQQDHIFLSKKTEEKQTVLP